MKPVKADRSLVSLVETYYDDPVGYARDVLGARPTHQQVRILEALAEHRRVSVRSGHGIGKDAAASMAILWFLTTRRGKVPCTAPTARQLYDVLWSELSLWWKRLPAWLGARFELTRDRFVCREAREDWFAAARTSRRENPDALQGFHADHLMFVLDEASGIPDEVIEPVLGALTGPDNYCLLLGNMVRSRGFFYDSHHRHRAHWHCLHFSSEDSPLVEKSWIEEMAARYGRDSSIYQVRVLGEPPKKEADRLIGLELLEAAVRRYDQTPEGGLVVWGLDPARFGDDESVLCRRRGDRIESLTGVRRWDTMQVSGWVAAQWEMCPERDRPSRILVDAIGLGAGVADRLKELGLPVIGVNVSESPSLKERYANFRAELWGRFAGWLEERRGGLPDDQDLLAQASSLKFFYDSAGRIRLEKKEDLKKRGLPSPDRADAVVLTFYGPTPGRGPEPWLRISARPDRAVSDYLELEN